MHVGNWDAYIEVTIVSRLGGSTYPRAAAAGTFNDSSSRATADIVSVDFFAAHDERNVAAVTATIVVQGSFDLGRRARARVDRRHPLWFSLVAARAVLTLYASVTHVYIVAFRLGNGYRTEGIGIDGQNAGLATHGIFVKGAVSKPCMQRACREVVR